MLWELYFFTCVVAMGIDCIKRLIADRMNVRKGNDLKIYNAMLAPLIIWFLAVSIASLNWVMLLFCRSTQNIQCKVHRRSRSIVYEIWCSLFVSIANGREQQINIFVEHKNSLSHTYTHERTSISTTKDVARENVEETERFGGVIKTKCRFSLIFVCCWEHHICDFFSVWLQCWRFRTCTYTGWYAIWHH